MDGPLTTRALADMARTPQIPNPRQLPYRWGRSETRRADPRARARGKRGAPLIIGPNQLAHRWHNAVCWGYLASKRYCDGGEHLNEFLPAARAVLQCDDPAGMLHELMCDANRVKTRYDIGEGCADPKEHVRQLGVTFL